jgi:hypothetical protein
MVLLLAACLCGLAVHLFAESLGGTSLFPMPARAEGAGHFDDHFVLSSPASICLSLLLFYKFLPVSLPRTSYGLPPLLPPPNS